MTWVVGIAVMVLLGFFVWVLFTDQPCAEEDEEVFRWM